MLLFSNNIKNLIESGTAETFYLLLIKDANGVVELASTTHIHDIAMGNGITYSADDSIVAVDLPQLNTIVDREQYKVSLADPEFNFGAVASTWTGKTLETRLGFVNPVDDLPFTSMDDTLVVYRGRIDACIGQINTGELGDSLLNISGASPMMALNMKRGFFISKEFIRSRNPNDSSCDSIYTSASPVIAKWGKK